MLQWARCAPLGRKCVQLCALVCTVCVQQADERSGRAVQQVHAKCAAVLVHANCKRQTCSSWPVGRVARVTPEVANELKRRPQIRERRSKGRHWPPNWRRSTWPAGALIRLELAAVGQLDPGGRGASGGPLARPPDALGAPAGPKRTWRSSRARLGDWGRKMGSLWRPKCGARAAGWTLASGGRRATLASREPRWRA